MLLRLYVAASGKPELRIPVIYQEDVLFIDNGEVRNEMLWGRGRFCTAEQFGARIDPTERFCVVVAFDFIKRLNEFKLRKDLIAHVRLTYHYQVNDR